ncbi:hypothetical protein [Rhodococcus opacus]|uniref:Uncharacterized protein n=1 Tax=Rhodococcus opacus TaxID=37919 RepID=A0A076F658_RHOOP|nr:hypothetical protein [Rhodococcus opacus]AII11184.1 hypothetical protein EP51_44885 [Rhodococcus opacus]
MRRHPHVHALSGDHTAVVFGLLSDAGLGTLIWVALRAVGTICVIALYFPRPVRMAPPTGTQPRRADAQEAPAAG